MASVQKTLKTVLLLMLVCIGFATNAHAQRNGGRLSLGVGLLYANGMAVTLAYEHEMNYRQDVYKRQEIYFRISASTCWRRK